MANFELRHVECIDPCDPLALRRRYIPLLVQTTPKILNSDTPTAVLSAWLPEPKLVTPVTLLNEITPDAVIQKIHVVDQVFGNQTVQYIVASRPPHPGAPPLAERNLIHDKNAILALWLRAVRGLDYGSEPGQVEATIPFVPGRVNLTGARSDFVASSASSDLRNSPDLWKSSYLTKYDPVQEVLADGVPTYCDCQVQNYGGGRRMIQCSNGEHWCLKEWYHLDCIGMKDKEVPPEDYDWYCKDCVEDRIGKLKTTTYVPWRPIPSTTQPHRISTSSPRDHKEKRSKKAKNEIGRLEKSAEDRVPLVWKSSSTVSSSQTSNPQPDQDLRINVPVQDFRTPTNTQSYSAEMDKQFILANHTADFSLNTLEEARASLLRGTNANVPNSSTSLATTTTSAKKGKWSTIEEDALIQVVRECVGEGLAGEPMWEVAVPRLHARGITRTSAACKMVWCRGLRARAAVDERRRKDAENMITALQDGKKRERGKKNMGRKSEREKRREAEDREWEDVLLLSNATGPPALRRVRAMSI